MAHNVRPSDFGLSMAGTKTETLKLCNELLKKLRMAGRTGFPIQHRKTDQRCERGPAADVLDVAALKNINVVVTQWGHDRLLEGLSAGHIHLVQQVFG